MKTVKIIIISSCAAGAVLLLGAGFMLYRGISDFNIAKNDRAKVKRSLEKYYKAPIFPSLENVKQELDNSKQADAWFTNLVSVLNNGNVSSGETSPTKFKTATYNVRRNLDQKARKSGTDLPASSELFAFGFERYAGTEGTLPQSDDVSRLIEQLVIINRISTILFENNIKSISSIKRDIFETLTGPVEKPKARPNNRRGHRGDDSERDSGSNASLKNVGIISGDDLFAKMHFVFEFRAKEKSLLDILNAFSNNPMFIVVTSVSLSKNTPPLVPAVIDPDAGNVVDPGWDRGRGKAEVAIEEPKLGPNHPVCGINMEIPLEIRIELDVYKFKKEASSDSRN